MYRIRCFLGPAMISFFSQTRAVLGYDGNVCCNLAKADQAFIGVVPPFENQICAQQYSNSIPAALPLYVSYTYCSSKCSGIGLSKPNQPNQWAAPLVQFILPSVIFSMTIPRRKKIEYNYLFDWPIHWIQRPGWLWINSLIQLSISFCCFLIILIPVFIDTLIWISVIVVGAGNMLVGGLYEAHLDYRIVKYVNAKSADGSKDEEDLKGWRELLVTVASGNLQLEEGSPHTSIPDSLTITNNPKDEMAGKKKAMLRLLNLLGAQASFGSAVGSPVLFYLGAFVYTILDLMNDPSSEDSAISLGFGIEWMIIVHVSIVSGCLLASNNPSTSSGIVGGDHEALRPPKPHRAETIDKTSRKPDPQSHRNWEWVCHKILGWSDAYDTEFQPVSLWSRGTNKMRWVKKSRAWRDESFKSTMHISAWGWLMKIFLPSLLLIVLPPAAGGIVAFFTPPLGVACRSLSFIIYAACQIAITFIALVRNAVDNGQDTEAWKWRFSSSNWRADLNSNLKWLLTGYSFWVVSGLWWFSSLLAAIGGTTMQIMGVYRNCICYAGAGSWWNVDKVNPPIQIANDTQAARNSSRYWIWCGSIAMAFMGVNCYIGWWYQRLIRHRFTETVKSMYAPAASTSTTPAENPSTRVSDLKIVEIASGAMPVGDNSEAIPLRHLQSVRADKVLGQGSSRREASSDSTAPTL